MSKVFDYYDDRNKICKNCYKQLADTQSLCSECFYGEEEND